MVDAIKNILRVYEFASSLSVNYQKSEVMFSGNIDASCCCLGDWV